MGKDLFGEYHCVVKSPPDTVKSDTAVVLEGTPFESKLGIIFKQMHDRNIHIDS